MSRVCTVCRHPEKAAIDTALVARPDSIRDVAGQYGLSKSAVERHRRQHLPTKLAKAVEAKEVASASGLLAQMQDLQRRTLEILQRPENQRTAIAAIAQARANIELIGELIGTLAHQPTIQVAVVELPTLNDRRIEAPDAA